MSTEIILWWLVAAGFGTCTIGFHIIKNEINKLEEFMNKIIKAMQKKGVE